jgi:hypothetical protein
VHRDEPKRFNTDWGMAGGGRKWKGEGAEEMEDMERRSKEEKRMGRGGGGIIRKQMKEGCEKDQEGWLVKGRTGKRGREA